MTDVFPRRNLPEDAEQWGRAHDERVMSLESQIQVLSQSLSGQNRNSASSIQTLSNQVKDLAGREAYNTSSGESQTWTTPLVTPFTFGPTLSLTLTQARVISIQSFVSATVYTLATNASSSAFAYLKGAIFLNGSVITSAAGEMGTNVGILPNTGRASTYNGTILSRALITLPAGTYTIQGGFSERNAQVSGSPASGNAYVSASNPALFIDVLQPA